MFGEVLFTKQLRLGIMALAKTDSADFAVLRTHLWQRRDILLSDLGEQMIENFLETSGGETPEVNQRFMYVAQLMYACREEGIEGAFGAGEN